MKRAARKTPSTYASNHNNGAPASAGAPAATTAPRSEDSRMLETIASQMKAFGEGLSAANRMCEENKLLLASSFLEAQESIAQGRAAAAADTKAAAAIFQQQLDFKPTGGSLINPGNDAQYIWNCSILNIITAALTGLELEDPDEAKLQIRKAIAEIFTRNKHIKMADESPAGWGLIKEYTKHSQAADEADDAKIKRCEAAALAKKKKPAQTATKSKPAGRGRGKGSETAPGPTSTLDPVSWALLQNSAQQYMLPSFGQFAPAAPTVPKILGPCYTCQGPHMQKDCPYVKAQNAALQAHLASTVAAAPGNIR